MKTESKSSLEMITTELSGSFGERRHLGRMTLARLSLGSEQFRLAENGKLFSITDLSRQGMGFWLLDPDDRHLFSVGMKVEGRLNLKRQKYDLQARVRHLGADRVGCEFEGLSTPLTLALHQFLDPYFLGSELKPIPSSERNILWYHGPSGTDLLLTRALDGQYEKFTLYALGTCVEWNQIEGLITAETSVSDHQCERSGIFKREIVFLVPDTNPDPAKLSIAKTVILGSNLPHDLKTWCVRRLEHP